MKADDLYTKVTNDIIRIIEQGAGSWSMPWRKVGLGSPRSMSSGKPYRGVNWVILTIEQMDHGYASNKWGTFKQWLGHSTDDNTVCVRKGSKGTHIFLWQPGTPPSKAMLARDPNAKPYLLAKTFTVFNRDQVDGLPAEAPADVLTEHERWDQADDYFRTIGANVVEDGDRAYYAPANDRIAVPTLAQFPNRDHFYTTMAHEHVHWTGHESRLNRDLHNRFGDDAYAAEELVAELGAAFWGAQMGLEGAVRDDHASYLASWLRVLKADSKAIVTAASQAQKAVDHLNTLAAFEMASEAEAVAA
jgi:antirestriction protein ArdC